MIHLADSNIFIAMAVENHASHRIAVKWFESTADSDGVAFCRATQTTFLRLLTRKIAGSYSPLTNRQAWEVYDQLLGDDAITFVEEPANLGAVWRECAARDTISPKVWMDAYLAAFAISGGLRLVSLDQDFRIYQAHGLDLLLLGS